MYERYDVDAHTARLVAAWIKAYGYRPCGVDLAPIAKLSANAMRGRLRRAWRRGFLRRTTDRRGWEPVWELIPERLARPRPELAEPTAKARPIAPWIGLAESE